MEDGCDSLRNTCHYRNEWLNGFNQPMNYNSQPLQFTNSFVTPKILKNYEQIVPTINVLIFSHIRFFRFAKRPFLCSVPAFLRWHFRFTTIFI